MEFLREVSQKLLLIGQILNYKQEFNTKISKFKQNILLIFYNQQKSREKIMLYNFGFETQTHLDEDCHIFESNKPYTLQNTTNTSPSSVKSQDSFGIQLEHQNDCSFELGSQVSHASNIWDASVNLLNRSIQFSSQNQIGFNDQDIYRYTTFSHSDKEKTIDEAIKSNRILRYKEKVNFIQSLKRETELCGLLVELMTLFNFQVFNQLLFVVHTIWNQIYLKYREQKSKKNCFSLPRFSCFFEIGEQQERYEIDSQYKDIKQISAAARQNIEELAKQIFSSRKIRYLNLQDIKGAKMNNRVLKEEFEKFIEIVSKAVFLSAQGIYEEQISIPIFSEQEEEESDLFNLDNGNRFVRTYSQIQQEDETEFKVQGGSKHRKIF